MPFRRRLKNPRTMMAIGTVCTSRGLMLPYFLHPTAGVAMNLFQGVRGMLIGFGLVTNLWFVVLTSRQRKCGAS
jgi:hypothetical protein